MVWLGFLGVSLAALGAAYGFEFIGGLKPCVLCLYQRVPYGLTAGLGVGALLFYRPAAAVPLGILFALLFLGGAGLSFYHLGVEQGWFTLPPACGGETGRSLETLRESLATTAPVPCDEVAWSFFGISLAGFNLVLSIFLTGLALAATASFRKGRTS
ncbi:MAG: disulfide bond formation protein B [Alphaproteobacteria bacterium]